MAIEQNGQQIEIEQINGISAGAAVDGWDLTQGAKTDVTASASTLSSTPAAPYSVIALLKAILAGQSTGAGGTGGAATIASGADVTEGATTDAPLAAAASTSASTISAAMKGLFNLFFNGTAKAGLVAGSASIGTVGLNAGSNVVGGITVADGSDATQGAKADTATTGAGITTGAFSVVALLKGIYNGVVGPTPAGTASIGTVGLNAGSNVVGGVTIAAGADATEGNTTDAPLVAAASTTSSTISSALKGLFNLFFNGTAKVSATPLSNIWWVEQNGASVAAGSSASGATRTNTVTGSAGPYAYFQATFTASQPGTCYISGSPVAGGNQINVTATIAAAGVVTLKVPAIMATFNTYYLNSNSTAGTASVVSGFTAA